MSENPDHQRIGAIEANLESLSNNLNRFISAIDRRFENLEGRVNQPFPMLQFAGVLITGFAVMGAMFTFALNPLFVDTERNRVALVDVNQTLFDRASKIAEFDAVKDRLASHQEWMQSLRDRERATHDMVLLLDSHVKEYQREAIEERRYSRQRQDKVNEDIFKAAQRIAFLEAGRNEPN